MPEIDLRPGFFMFAIVLAALDRSGSVLPILYAMGVHELAHVVMMLACGGRVRRLTLRFADLRIDAAGLGYRQELLAALAGPLVNLVCGALFCMRSPGLRGLQPDARGSTICCPSGRWTAAGGPLRLGAASAAGARRGGLPPQQLRGLRGAAAGGDHPDVFPPRRALAARHGGVSDAPAADAGKAHGRIAPTGSSGRETERYRLLFMPAAVTMK